MEALILYYRIDFRSINTIKYEHDFRALSEMEEVRAEKLMKCYVLNIALYLLQMWTQEGRDELSGQFGGDGQNEKREGATNGRQGQNHI